MRSNTILAQSKSSKAIKTYPELKRKIAIKVI